MIIDLDTLGADTQLDADLCLVGGGIAGLTIAHEFIEQGLRVLILEAGGRTLEPESQALYKAQIVGHPYPGHIEGRFRVFGGSSTRWGGQLLPLDSADLEPRMHVAHSGWPIPYDVLAPYYDRALDIMRVNHLPYDEKIWHSLGIKPTPFDHDLFHYRYSKWARFQHRNLASTVGSEVSRARNVDVLLHASVTHLHLDQEGQSVNRLSVRSLSGRTAMVRAKNYVLCCGTLETARLLLASNDIQPTGIGNAHGLVGRFFQDHISFRAAELRPTNPDKFSESFAPAFKRQVMHYPRIKLSPMAQQKFGCLGVFGHVQFESCEDSGFIVIREMLRRIQARQSILPSRKEIRNVLRDLPYLTQLQFSYFFGGQIPYPPRCHWFLQVDVEQEPSEQSRVFLTEQRDLLGLPILGIDWRPGERERMSVLRFVEQFRSEWERLKLGGAVWNDTITAPGASWLTSASDTYHQAGTARMSTDPHLGVVDQDLQVHGVSNLYIGSCAVFPTSGSANPTFTMMALCLRLADHLFDHSKK